jgi:hypothetical protein
LTFITPLGADYNGVIAHLLSFLLREEIL